MLKLKEIWWFLFLIVFILQLLLKNCSATHITGSFHPNEFFKFIVKFGFQKTERHSQRDSFGYIYGNITSKDNFPVNLTLAVLDKYSFLEFYGNRSLFNKETACHRMFNHLEITAYDNVCNTKAKGDYLRKVPCPMGKLCIDEDSPTNVVPGNQFTYVITDLIQPRFWYVSLVSCYRNTTTCKWHYFDYKKYINKLNNNNSNSTIRKPTFEINYDFCLVNGNPNQSTSNPLTFHFSFDQQNILEMNLIFFIVYLILIPMQIYAVRIQKHPVTKLFTLSLVLEFISLWFILSYMIRFAISGVGNETYKTTGDILDIFSRSSFMLILLLLAKGWAVTRQQISKTSWLILMSIWIPYCAFHVVLYVWNRTEVDIISDIDEYQTWPGWLVLACRSTIMLWFLWELRTTMKYEHSTKKLDFLLHFGASSLVWFIYLPIVALVALQVSPMWRYKLLLGITNSADCLAYCVMTGLLWPNRAGQYLLLAGTNYSGMDELDEFNEAPHIVHGDTSTLTTTTNTISPTNCDTIINSSGGGEPTDLNYSINHIDNKNKHNNILINGDITTDLLDDDGDEDIILSTEDLLINNNNINSNNNNIRFLNNNNNNNNINNTINNSNQYRNNNHHRNDNFMEINSEAVDLNINSNIIA